MRHSVKVNRGILVVLELENEAPTAERLLDRVREVMRPGDYVVLTTWLPRTRSTTHFHVKGYGDSPRLSQTMQVSEAIRDLKAVTS